MDEEHWSVAAILIVQYIHTTETKNVVVQNLHRPLLKVCTLPLSLSNNHMPWLIRHSPLPAPAFPPPPYAGPFYLHFPQSSISNPRSNEKWYATFSSIRYPTKLLLYMKSNFVMCICRFLINAQDLYPLLLWWHPKNRPTTTQDSTLLSMKPPRAISCSKLWAFQFRFF